MELPVAMLHVAIRIADALEHLALAAYMNPQKTNQANSDDKGNVLIAFALQQHADTCQICVSMRPASKE